VGKSLNGAFHMFSLDADSATSLSPLLFVMLYVFWFHAFVLFRLKVIHPRSVYKITRSKNTQSKSTYLYIYIYIYIFYFLMNVVFVAT